MSKTAVFYGAGQNAADNYAKWVSNGISPVCFIDSDIKKQNTKFLSSGLDILPIEAAIDVYSDFDVYITPTRDKWDSIVTELLKHGIDLKSIKLFEPLEYRLGCYNMGKCYISHDSIGVCCSPEYMKKLELEASQDQRINFERYNKQSSEVISKWRNNEPSVCDGCPNLEYGFWELNPVIEILNISSKQGGDFCNTKCMYCVQFPKPGQRDYENRRREVVSLLKTAHEVYPEHEFRVVVSGGDIAVAPYRDELFNLLEDYGWVADIYSNSVVFCEGVADKLADGHSTYITTLDSTNKKKFAEIKGVNCLPKVLENIKRYSNAAVDKRQIKIKLIVLDGVYGTFDEMSGVVDFAESIGSELMLSCNVERISERMSTNMAALANQWVEYALSKGIPVNIMYDHFNNNDIMVLKERFEGSGEFATSSNQRFA